MAEDESENTYVTAVEDVAGRQTVVLYYQCPKCRTRTRFTAEDEQANGTLVCPGFNCLEIVGLEGDGLRGTQGQMDADDRMILDSLDLFGSG